MNTSDMYGRTPLFFAAEGGHEAVVELLLSCGNIVADPKDIWGEQPLSFAAGRGHDAVVRLFIKRDDVNVNSIGESGRTPLSLAAETGLEAVVRLLEPTWYEVKSCHLISILIPSAIILKIQSWVT